MMERVMGPMRGWLDRLGGIQGLAGSRVFSPTGSVSLFSLQIDEAPRATEIPADEADKRAFLAAEYGYCRAAIGTFDGILTDLRTRGVAMVLAFDGVAAIVSGTVPTSVWGGQVRLATVVQLVAMLLFIPLIRLDVMYTKFWLNAVRRAHAIEVELGTPLSRTLPLSQALESAAGSHNSVTRNVQLVVYGVLFVLGLFLAYLYQTAGG
jgi:hypothetical protein